MENKTETLVPVRFSVEPRFYFSAIPLLLAAACNMTWEQFQAMQLKEKGRLLEQMVKRIQLDSQAGGDSLAAVFGHVMLNLHGYIDAPVEAFENNAKYIFERSMDVVDNIVEQMRNPPVEGPRVSG